MRGRIASLIVVGVGLLLAAPTGASAQSPAPARGSTTVCPGTFTVLHNDRIGALSLPAGRYVITVRTPVNLTCQGASQLFAQFLRRPKGDLPNGWGVNVKR